MNNFFEDKSFFILKNISFLMDFIFISKKATQKKLTQAFIDFSSKK